MNWRIPASWAWTTMGDVSHIVGGGTPRTADKANFQGGEIPWITPADLSGYAEKYISHGKRNITQKGLVSSSARLMPKGTVLLSSRAPIGYVAIASNSVCTNQGFKSFVLPDSLDSEYVYYYLMRARSIAIELASGTTFLEISGKRAAKIPLPMAPLPQQHRIVAAIESYLTRLDAAVASLERVQKSLKRYRASVLKAAVEGLLVPTEAELAKKEGRTYEPASELLNRILDERRKKWIENAVEKAHAKAEKKARKTGQSWTHADDIKTLEKERAKAAKKYKEPVAPDTSNLPDLPEGWCWATIECLLREPLRNGHSAKATSDPDGIRTLTLTAVTQGIFSTQNTKITSADPQKVADLWLEPGDLLVERSNTVELVGTTALFDGPSGFAIFPDLMIRVRLLDGILPKWTESVLRSQRVRTHFQLTAQGIAGTMPKISQGIVATLPVPVPPWAEQHRIVDALVLQELSSTRIASDSTKATAQSQTLRQSILKWAFEGKLVEQDPNDEPASVLLERIKAERESMQPRKKRRTNKKKQPRKHDEQLDLLGGSNT